MLGNTAIKASDGHNYMAQAAPSAIAGPLQTCAGPAFFDKDRIVFTDCPFDSEKLTRHIRGTPEILDSTKKGRRKAIMEWQP